MLTIYIAVSYGPGALMLLFSLIFVLRKYILMTFIMDYLLMTL